MLTTKNVPFIVCFIMGICIIDIIFFAPYVGHKEVGPVDRRYFFVRVFRDLALGHVYPFIDSLFFVICYFWYFIPLITVHIYTTGYNLLNNDGVSESPCMIGVGLSKSLNEKILKGLDFLFDS